MARINKTVCDRCGKEIKYHGWTALVNRPRRVHVRELLNGNQSGYDYSDWDFELCNACTSKFHEFMKRCAQDGN